MLTHDAATILGDIPGAWRARPLRELLIRDETLAGDWGEDSGEKGLSVLRSTNFTNDGHLDLSEVARRYYSVTKADQLGLKPDDILLERSGGGPDQPIGRVVLIEQEMPGFGFGNFIQRLRPDPNVVNPQYLRWVLHEIHRSGVIERLQYQTTQMRNLDYRDYQRALLPYPELDEQERIADLITNCDRLILVAKRLLGVRGSLHRDDMRGYLNTVKTALLQNLITGRRRVMEAVNA